ncbi:A-type flavoprotein 7 [Spironucleus salmonicida]|uniref:A-type flavoprotein 7 n=1 Tax=Spironucleus salmonicida TaxID=348837 RepID=K7R8N4_9EUKA|nr:A-type flavoprotein 7 [Spironucleus salmonicida]KAH0572186.1 A-type flavoprotein 7 [Spironucleus salmonicida]|eukprot:EST47738.1 A-type flavoprotein 7 [Spironucleus salmonicida]
MKGVETIGVVDYNEQDFHKLHLSNGINYNSYMIKDNNETVIIDTVPESYFHQFLINIQYHAQLSDIKHIIINHAEQESSGSLLPFLRVLEDATIYCSHKCAQTLKFLYPDIIQFKFQLISRRETLKLGELEFKFIQIPLLHWPDSTMTYYVNKHILFSSDLFSQIGAETDQASKTIYEIKNELSDYAQNIFGSYKTLLLDNLQKFKAVSQDFELQDELYTIKSILPAHGMYLHGVNYVQAAIDAYTDVCCSIPKNPSVLIAYDTLYGNSVKQAQLFSQFLSSKGVIVHIHSVRTTPLAQIAFSMNQSQGLIIGSPVFNQDISPLLVELLYLFQSTDSLEYKISYSFGSYGWNKGILEPIFRDELKGANCHYLGHVEYKMGLIKDNTEIQKVCDSFYKKLINLCGKTFQTLKEEASNFETSGQ